MTASSFDHNDFFGVGTGSIGAIVPNTADWQKNLTAVVNVTSAAAFTSVLSIPVPGAGRYRVIGIATVFNSSLGGGGNIASINLTDGTTVFAGAASALSSTVGTITTFDTIPVVGEILETGPATISMNVAFSSANSGVAVGGAEIFGSTGGLFTSSATQLFITKVSRN